MRFDHSFPLLACGVGGYFAYHRRPGTMVASADLEKRKAVLAGDCRAERVKALARRALPGLKASTRTCSTSAPAPFDLAHPDHGLLKRRVPA
jgi:hypothetical protein